MGFGACYGRSQSSKNAIIYNTLLTLIQGVICTITTKKGEVFAGVFAGATTEVNESAFLFKMVRRSSQLPKESFNGVEDCNGEFLGTGSDHSVVFSMGDIIDISIPSISTTSNHVSQNGKTTNSI